MTNDYELAAYDKASLKYTPEMLFLPAEAYGDVQGEVRPREGERDPWLTSPR